MGTDIGLLGISATMGRLRGRALGLGDLITGSRFLRGFILPGGVRPVLKRVLLNLKGRLQTAHELKNRYRCF
jgi:Ni,Fe-hydrogenase III large subunit